MVAESKERNRKIIPSPGSNNNVLSEKPLKEGPKASLEQLFSNRPSLLDVKQLATEHALSTNLTGFYHFFWIILTFFVVSTFFVNWVETGKVLSGKLRDACFGDANGVLLGEALFLLLVILSGLSVFVCDACLGFLRNILPFSALMLGSGFGFYRAWSGLQRAIYLLHSLSVFMKLYAFLYHHRHIKVPLTQFNSKFYHLIYFAFAPTMLYSESYPKTDRYKQKYSNSLFLIFFSVRKVIVLERLAGIFLCGISMYIVVEEYILPVVQGISVLDGSLHENFIRTLFIYSKLLLPCNSYFLLGFFFVFEYWCNLFAELTCFADRQFYTDWWNGISFYDFSTRWNIPVHKFLQKYIYRHLIEEAKYSKSAAMTVTFVFSSIFHELVMFVMMGPSKYIFTFLFVYQMLQIPLISLVVGTGWAKNNVNLANWVFWIMLVLGIPTVVLSYALFAV
jgi:hypothetical protein